MICIALKAKNEKNINGLECKIDFCKRQSIAVITGIPFEVTAADLEQVFSEFGECTTPKKKARSMATIQFDETESVYNAIRRVYKSVSKYL
jgi:hypothetical protein